MQRQVNARLLVTTRVVDVLVIVLTYVATLTLRSLIVAHWPFNFFSEGPRILRDTAILSYLGHLIVFIPAWMFGLHVSRSYEGFARVRSNILLFRVCGGVLVGALTSLAVLFLLKQAGLLSRTLFLGFALVSMLTLFLGRRWVVRLRRRRFRKGNDTRNILVVNADGAEIPLIEILERHADLGMRIIGVVRGDDEPVKSSDRGVHPVLGAVRDLPRILEDHPVDQVYATGRRWDVGTLRAIADTCEVVGVDFSIDANFLGLRMARAELEEMDGSAVLSFSTTPADVEALAVKRLIDIVLSSAALVLLSPLYLLTALAIKLEDPRGPVLYGQRRSGLHGRDFTMWKFRSMIAGAEKLQEQLRDRNEVDGPVFKITADPRVTRVGRWIRKLSIDELPQLWNVLIGEMSLVGPRPPIPDEVRQYERWQMRRLSMKPGLTCLWQVDGRNNIDFNTWMDLDLEYIDNWSLFLDLKLLLRTPRAVITGTGK